MNFNLFPLATTANDQDALRTQRISTRVFILLLTAAVIILVIYTSTETINDIKTVTLPSLSRYLELSEKYPQTLSCPCTTISIAYRTFLNISYISHQICNSSYVSDPWLAFLLTFHASPLWADDFRATASMMFQGIRRMCELADTSLSLNLLQFYNRGYLTAAAIPEYLLQTDARILTETFIASTIDNFRSKLQFIRDTTQANALTSASWTNAGFSMIPGSIYVNIAWKKYDNNCSCGVSSQCTRQAVIYRNNDRSAPWYAPSFYRGCFILEGLRHSTLACLYNQTCSNELIAQMGSSTAINITALEVIDANQSLPNATFDNLMNTMMLESWNWSASYPAYYAACQPSSCRYSVTTKHNLFYIVAAVFSLIGGLTTVLKLTVPRVVWLIRWRINRTPTAAGTCQKLIFCRYLQLLCLERITPHPSLKQLLSLAFQYSKNLNFFRSFPPSTDQHVLRAQRISTRIFILLLILAAVILAIYTYAVTIIENITVQLPSLSQYRDLNEKYSQTLSCPCTEVSIGYKSFLQLNHTFHQVCQSFYVSGEWISFLGRIQESFLWVEDFRFVATLTFQSLRFLCELANRSISLKLDEFDTYNYVSANVVPETTLQSQSQALIEDFMSSTVTSFILSLRTIRDTTQANILLSAIMTNYFLYASVNSMDVRAATISYGSDCGCASSPSCHSASVIYANNSLADVWTIPGMNDGCYVMEALRASSLNCFYDHLCLTRLFGLMGFPSTGNATTLDTNRAVHFDPNTTVGSMVDEMMIESWNWSVSHRSYYEKCHPKHCTYSVVGRHDLIYIITTVFGLIGGLETVLRFLVPRLVSLLFKCLNRYDRRTENRVGPNT